jgi:hypothetical protein
MNNNNDNDTIQISGSIGMVKLVKNTKNIFIFYDDHSNTKYCKNNDSIFLYDLFDKVIQNNSDYLILLEEPFVNNYSNIEFLWNDIPHIVKFRNFYKKIIKKCSDTKICNVFPVDIRLIICDISIDELVLNINNKEYFNDYKISIYEYFKYLLYLFDCIDYDEEKFKNSDKNIKFLKKVFDNFKNDKYYIKLKEQFDIIYLQFIEPNISILIYDFLLKNKFQIYDLSIGFPFENNNNNKIFLNQYDKLINGIMEFYIYILLSMNYKNIIIYSGYYHSNNLTYILEKYFDFKKIYNIGNTTDIEKKKDIYINNCIYVNKKIF